MHVGELMQSLLYVGTLIVTCAALHVVVPATVVTGYACDKRGQALVYRLNGLRVLFIVVLAFLGLSWANVIDGEYLANNIWPCFHAGNIYGLLCSFIFYVKGKRLPANLKDEGRRAITVDQVKRKQENSAPSTTKPSPSSPASSNSGVGAFLMDFYAGLEFNPRAGLFDYKMFLYLVGAVILECVLVSAAIKQYHALGRLSLGLTTYLVAFSFFVAEYMYHEHVHLYTYDLFAERVGFKLIWGCLCFYPFFYGIGVWSLLERGSAEDISPLHAGLSLACFVLGWVLSRGANNQKYRFKTAPGASFLGIAPRTIPGSRILCSGWWGLARHINYLGEILMAVGLALPGGIVASSSSSSLLLSLSVLPWLYPLYYVALLLPREREDSRVCALKYGQAWQDYCRTVPSRIIPFLY